MVLRTSFISKRIKNDEVMITSIYMNLKKILDYKILVAVSNISEYIVASIEVTSVWFTVY